MSEEIKQVAEKKIFLLFLAVGLGGFAGSIILFGFPKAGAYGSYEGWEGWVIAVVGLFAAWRHKKKSPTTLPENRSSADAWILLEK